MAEPPDYLIVALSARALTAAARRCGLRVCALDLFGDTDLRASASDSRVVPGDLETGFDETALIEAAEELAPSDAKRPLGLVYGAGFENRPELLARLCHGRRLFGNAPQTVARCKDPRAFFGALDELRIPHPEVAFTAPQHPEGWLVKRIGSSGGAHVAPYAGTTTSTADCYYQRCVSGRAIGVAFLANGKRACVVGFNEQWTDPGATGSFRFGGVVQPAVVEPGVAARVRALLDPLVKALGLMGLNSLDVMVEDEHFQVLEVNPRPGASLDIYDGADRRGFAHHLFARHLRTFAGEPPERWQPADATAATIVYAENALLITRAMIWPHWIADRPAAGTRIAAGAPVCTVLAAAATPTDARELIATRVAAVRSLLQNESSGPAASRENLAVTSSGVTA